MPDARASAACREAVRVARPQHVLCLLDVASDRGDDGAVVAFEDKLPGAALIAEHDPVAGHPAARDRQPRRPSPRRRGRGTRRRRAPGLSGSGRPGSACRSSARTIRIAAAFEQWPAAEPDSADRDKGAAVTDVKAATLATTTIRRSCCCTPASRPRASLARGRVCRTRRVPVKLRCAGVGIVRRPQRQRLQAALGCEKTRGSVVAPRATRAATSGRSCRAGERG